MDPLIMGEVKNVEVPAMYQLTVEQMEVALLYINFSKSSGPDGIPSWILCDFAGVLGGPYCTVFNSSMFEGYVPEEWGVADVYALSKQNPPQYVDSDLHPISLTPIISKANEGIICKWIWDCIANQVNPDQYCCMRMTGTVHILINLVHNWSAATDKLRSFTRILLLDCKKAFDHVDQTIVFRKTF